VNAVTRSSPTRWFLASVFALTLAGASLADNWPQWRGPTNDGICKETGLPTEWSETKNVAWKLPMPAQAGSTPAIWGDRIFLTSEDGNQVVLMCVSTQGKELWRKPMGKHNGQKYMSGEGNNASASPCTDGKHVWALDGAGDFVCCDFTGHEVWTFSVQDRYGPIERRQIQHGFHNSPVLDGDRLYMNLLHSGAWLVLAIDKATGKEIWKHERKSDAYAENEHSYASPIVWRKGQDAYLVVHGNDYTTAHSLDDGHEIWRLADLNPQDNPNLRYQTAWRFVASPVVTPDMIVSPTAKSGLVAAIRTDARGTVRAGGAGELWRVLGITPDVSCPLVHDGCVYLCRDGNLICLDAKTGKQHYRTDIHRARYRASPVYADGRIYVLARDGFATVVKPGSKFEKLAENKLPDDTSASMAISNGRIYIRGWKNLYAISEGGK
jgi:outer membrane protein assembly factor BamB